MRRLCGAGSHSVNRESLYHERATSGLAPVVITAADLLERDELASALSFYRDNPVRYTQDIILRGVTGNPRCDSEGQPIRVSPFQADVMDLVAQHDRVALRAANGVGKDVVTAWLIEWYLMTRYLCKIPVVSATGRQVRRTIFSEVALWTRQSLAIDKLDIMLSNELRHKTAPELWWALGFAPATSGDDPTGSAEGLHAEHLLFVVTEAKAVDESVWSALERSCTRPGNKAFAQSVPGVDRGGFFDCFNVKARDWKGYHYPGAKWSGREKKWAPTTEFVSERSISLRLRDGEDGPDFRAGVLAEFLNQGSAALISSQDMTRAFSEERWASLPKDDACEFGLDVARFGDDLSCLAIHRGKRFLPLQTWHGADLMETCGRLVNAINEHKPFRVRIDVIGIGAGVYDRLIEMQDEETDEIDKEIVTERGRFNKKKKKHPLLAATIIEPINVGEKSMDQQRWVNRRDEYWDAYARALREGTIALSDDPQLAEESTTVQYKFTSAGQKKIEPKADHKKRLGRSPDRADAVCLALGGPWSGDSGVS